IEKNLIAAGWTPEDAKRIAKERVEAAQAQEKRFGFIFGPFQALLSPLMGAQRSFVSRPLEETTGIPMDVTEGALAVVGAGAAMPAMQRGFMGQQAKLTRVRVDRDGKVSAQAVGELPKDEDFKTATDVLTGKGEKIGAPAVKINGEVFEGESTHSEAFDKAFAKLGDEGIAKFADKIEEGWTTSTGRFVDRKEAAHIAGMGDAGGEFHAVPHFEDYQAKAERDAANVEANLRTLWEERGIHPAEALHEADRDAWFKNELMQPPRGEDTTAASVHEDVYGQLKATGMSD